MSWNRTQPTLGSIHIVNNFLNNNTDEVTNNSTVLGQAVSGSFGTSTFQPGSILFPGQPYTLTFGY